jgi:transposase
MGRSRGGISSKIHCITNEKGLPIDFKLTSGEVHDAREARGLLEGKKACYVIADKGYDAKSIINVIKDIGAEPVIPSRSCCIEKRTYNKEIYKKRNLIERFFNRLKCFRRIATRYERKAINFLSMIWLAGSILWLNHLIVDST